MEKKRVLFFQYFPENFTCIKGNKDLLDSENFILLSLTSWDIKLRVEWKKQDWWHIMSTSCHLIDDNKSIIDLQRCTVEFFFNCSIIHKSILTLVLWES